MINVLSRNKQLFVVDSIAKAGLKPDAIPDNSLAIIDEATNLSVSPTNFKSLPQKFRLIGKKNGNVYYSFDTIEKQRMLRSVSEEYKAPEAQEWKVVINSCNCIKSAKIDIHLLESSLIAEAGLTWTHRDSYVEVSPAEFSCYCSCEGNGTYENNVMTMLLYKQILEAESPFYTAKVYKKDGDELADLEAVKTFIEGNKTKNTDDDKDNDGDLLELHIVSKIIQPTVHRDLEPNYTSPRGALLGPVLTVNEDEGTVFTLVKDTVLEIGAGYDLKQLEYSIMQYYTNLLNPRDLDGFQSEELVYQTDPAKQYDSVSFEFNTDKAERSGQGDFRNFIVILATEHDNGIFTKLKSLFVEQ